jgi:hypothetical protein
MNTGLHIQAKTESTPVLSPTPVNVGLLQRKCACGQHTVSGGECAECRKQKLSLQRRPADQAAPSSVPPIVHEVLRSPGQPLDPATRAFMEPRFGHDFSRVRVHTDSRAAESARAVNAMAYTVGQDVVFGAGEYTPGTTGGHQLLAHELTHTIQQTQGGFMSGRSTGALKLNEQGDRYEREADAVASYISDSHSRLDHNPFSLGCAPQGVVQRRAIYRGPILYEGTCAFLACNSEWACEDDHNGIACPEGTPNAHTKTGKKYRPLFACDTRCENNRTCEDDDTWMAIPYSRFARRKCNQDLVICANGHFTHAYVRDRSHRELSPGITDALGVARGTFTGSIYGDESDPEFLRDSRCRSAAESTSSASAMGDVAGGVAGAIGGAIGSPLETVVGAAIETATRSFDEF